MLGPHDDLDVFRASETDTAMKVAKSVRTSGRAQAEVWPATAWARVRSFGRGLR